MRIATMIIALVLMVVLGLQSCAVAVGGSVSKSLSTTANDKAEADKLSGGAAFGILAALLWVVAAGLVISKPKASAWLFGIATPLCLIGASAGFTDLYIWAVVSAALALMSYFGIKEKTRNEANDRGKYLADVNAAAHRYQPQSDWQAQGHPRTPQVAARGAVGHPSPQAGWYADPMGSGGWRYWAGTQWTEHHSAPVDEVKVDG